MNRITNGVIGLALKNCSFFSTAKKAKMELTVRTPYKTILDKFEGFSRIVAKTNEAALIIQNRTPAAVYILPPGPLKIKFTQDVKGITGDFLHLGGYVFVNPDNSCEINLLDVVDRKEAKVDQFDKADVKDADTVAGRYAGKIRRAAQRTFIKKATA
ncbi:unnamed protein product [Paramecium sonneborni]|uniref:Uncharacterized protein n=1 Tax=Paramecium sonneborni TaxID=65129 RepID=A0A8S1P3X1_9CILI|nr:unnamed protein product [Paramecium sonneborni]